jgi:hypothetical protein
MHMFICLLICVPICIENLPLCAVLVFIWDVSRWQYIDPCNTAGPVNLWQKLALERTSCNSGFCHMTLKFPGFVKTDSSTKITTRCFGFSGNTFDVNHNLCEN